jgi:hypothetical protein
MLEHGPEARQHGRSDIAHRSAIDGSSRPPASPRQLATGRLAARRGSLRLGPLGCALSVSMLAACTGMLEAPAASPAGTSPIAAPVACGPETIDLTAEPMRRLDATELGRAIETLLGVPLAETSSVPPEALGEGAHFSRQVALSVTEGHALSYRAVAEAAAARFTTDEEVRERLLRCDPAAPSCLETFVRETGHLVYRRPLVDAEVAALTTLGEILARPSDPYASYSAVLEGLLQSPDFLYLVEDGELDTASPPGTHVALDDFELATRLSLLLFGTVPDRALLDAVVAGAFADDASTRATVDRLLEDERVEHGLAAFIGEWLRLEEITSASRADDRYEDARDAMRGELEQLVLEAFTGEASLETLFTARPTYASAELAAVYGVTPDADGTFQRPADRPGLLGSAGILAATSNATSTSAARRGKFVRDLLLCDPPPPPPPDIPVVEPMEGESAADLEARHLEDPVCFTCHQQLDPIGWGLDLYGPIGEVRTVDETGDPVREAGYLATGDVQHPFSGAAELATLALETGQVEACVAEHFATYALARSMGSEEAACLVEDLGTTLEGGGSVRDLIVALVTSDAFTHRTMPDEPSPEAGGIER